MTVFPHIRAALAVFLCAILGTSSRAWSQPAEWTVLVYMNAKNTLELAALTDFLAISKIGSSPQVQIVIELGRPEKVRYTTAEENWTGVLRFHVEPQMHPVPESAVDPTGGSYHHADMASGKTLADFTAWGVSAYPARHTLLLIWSHGQGYRVFFAAQEAEPAYPNGFKGVSFDDDTQHVMYNRDLHDSLSGQHFDIIGFDACLMQMLESAHAFRDLASLMVASEDLIPDAGWRYDLWLQQLSAAPNIGASELVGILVTTYGTSPGTNVRNLRTTLSSLDLTKVEKFAQGLSVFSKSLEAQLTAELPAIVKARRMSRNYGDGLQASWLNCNGQKMLAVHSIDLGSFLSGYSTTTTSPTLAQAAKDLVAALRGVVTASVATPPSKQVYGSTGIGIYFPSTLADYTCDPSHDGYDVNATRAGSIPFPLEFVQNEAWADFLQNYLAVAPLSPHDM